MTKQTITALYDDRMQANQAMTMLRQSGIPTDDVSLSPAGARDSMETRGDTRTRDEESTGFWASLEQFFGSYDDHDTYREGIRRGGTLLTAHVAEDRFDTAVEILEKHGSVDLDEREASWRNEGWTGGSTQVNATGLGIGGTTAAVPAPKPAVAAKAGTDNEDVIQVVEERLQVGKRAVSRGKLRVHSYVVQKDVAEDVTLRDETVSIDRHAVDRPVAALGADAFKERTIEMEETGEEAVVGKTARVVEEIGIRKDVKDRVETVSDTIRSTKVDIEDDRAAAAKTDRLDGKIKDHLRGR